MSTEQDSRKWTSAAGPRQTKQVEDVLKSIRWQHGTSTTLSGVKGVDEHRFTSTLVFGGFRQDVADAWNNLGEQFGWSITRENYKAIVEAGQAALAKLVENTPVKDERLTPEQEEQRKQDLIDERAKRDAQLQARTAVFDSQYADPSTEIVLNKGDMAITLNLCYNDSDMMSDYVHRHARIGEVVLAIVPSQARTEALARGIVERYPELAELELKWHTENYSGGHGNYLAGETFELPAAVAEHYGKARGHWEVQFAHANYTGTPWRPYKGYPGAVPAAPAKDGTFMAVAGTVACVRHNAAQNGVEIHFPAKPSRDVIDRCKAAGFRWSMRSKCWYKRLGTYAWQQAHTIAGIEPAPPMPGSNGAVDPNNSFDMAVEDQMAERCGL